MYLVREQLNRMCYDATAAEAQQRSRARISVAAKNEKRFRRYVD